MIDKKIELYRDTLSKDEIDKDIDFSFYEEFDKALSSYKKAIGSERFTKLMEKHRPMADPQNMVVALRGEDERMQNVIAIKKKEEGESTIKMLNELKEKW